MQQREDNSKKWKYPYYTILQRLRLFSILCKHPYYIDHLVSFLLPKISFFIVMHAHVCYG